MGLFRYKKRPEDHPAYDLGLRLGRWLLNHERAFAKWMNQGQYAIGFRWRNLLIGLLLLFFLIQFIGDLLL